MNSLELRELLNIADSSDITLDEKKLFFNDEMWAGYILQK